VSFFWWILTIGVLIIWIASVADIIKRRKILSTTAVITWLLVVIVFPVLGSIVYLMVNGASGGLSNRPDIRDTSRMM
jgi:hypothetical protein